MLYSFSDSRLICEACKIFSLPSCSRCVSAGRISFRSIKKNRDYMQHRTHCSWHYLAHLAAVREFAYLKALHAHGFPVPKPVDMNRHAVLMEYIDAIPLSQVPMPATARKGVWGLKVNVRCLGIRVCCLLRR